MECNWTNQDFLNQITLLKKLIKEEKNPERKVYLQKVLDSSRYLASEFLSHRKKPDESIIQRLYSINDERLSYGRYYSIIIDFCERLLPLREEISEVESLIEKRFGDNFDIATLTGSTVSDDKAISIVATFYNNLDPDLLTFFEEAFSKRSTTLRFSGHINPQDSKGSDGSTLFIDGVRKNFINICKTDSCSKIFALIHEYGHAIRNLFNPERAYSNDEGLFDEVDGIFPELIALEDNISNINPFFITFLKYTNLITYYDYASSFVNHTVIIDEWKKNHYLLNTRLRRILRKGYGIDKKAFEDALDITLFDEGTYIISYLVAIELLHIYKKDKAYALKLYKEFLSIPADKDVLPFVNKLITINDSILKEATEIVSQMKYQLESYGGRHV